ncbi:hypothetical protein GN956_G22429 [Arapaima gigas]
MNFPRQAVQGRAAHADKEGFLGTRVAGGSVSSAAGTREKADDTEPRTGCRQAPEQEVRFAELWLYCVTQQQTAARRPGTGTDRSASNAENLPGPALENKKV